MVSLAFALGWISVGILGVLTYAFAHDPEKGLWTQAHRLDQLPRLMASRYVALAVLGAGILMSGSLPLLALFFLVAAGLGAIDAVIYKRFGGTVWPHASAAVLGCIATLIALVAMASAEAGELGRAAGAATSTLTD